MLVPTKDMKVGDTIKWISKRIGDCCPKINMMGVCPDHTNPATVYILEIKSITKIDDIKEAHKQ